MAYLVNPCSFRDHGTDREEAGGPGGGRSGPDIEGGQYIPDRPGGAGGDGGPVPPEADPGAGGAGVPPGLPAVAGDPVAPPPAAAGADRGGGGPVPAAGGRGALPGQPDGREPGAGGQHPA